MRGVRLVTSCGLAMLVSASAVCAQTVPTAITYQGKLSDMSGVPVSDGSRAMRFKLYDAQTSGTELWDSGAMSVVTTGGVFSTVLGAPPTPAITSAALTTDSVWLEVTVGTDPALPRVKLSSAPFALRAADVAMPFSKTVLSSPAFTPAFEVKNTTGNDAIRGQSNSASFAGVVGENTGSGLGLYGHSETGTAVRGYQQNSGNLGALGASQSGVLGSSGTGYGVWGYSTSGNAGYFNIDSLSNSSPALYVTTGGTGRAGRFEITNASSNAAALYAKTSGTGSSVWAESSTTATPLVAYNTGYPGNIAAYVEIFNSLNPNSALYSKTNGAGSAVYGVNSGTTGRAGSFSVTNASNSSPALYATTSGTGPAAWLNGRVGIGTSTPSAQLEVSGAATVTGNLSVGGTVSITPTTRYATLSGCDFRPVFSYQSYTGSFALSGTDALSDYSFVGPVHLPAGAVVTEVRAWALDNAAANAITIKLQRAVVSSPGVVDGDMATLTSSGASGAIQEFSTTTVSSATIDNQNCAYRVLLYWSTTSVPSDITFYRARIAYTTSSLGG